MGADLHCHTRLSDGSVAIDELVMLAKGRGISTISVTDHDTFAGSVRAKVLGNRHGISVVPGIEISSYDYQRKQKAHILCYYCENANRLEGLCRRIAENRKKSTQLMIQKVMRMYPISLDMILRRANGSTNIYKQHIMHALVDAGYTNEIFGPLYQKLFSHRGGLAHVPIEYPDVYEVLNLVHSAGGTTVLAHPGECCDSTLLEELASGGHLDGVEIWHPKNSEKQQSDFMSIAEKYHLVMTGGTDFHGMYSPRCEPIGSYLTPDDQLEKLKKCRAATTH